MARRLKSVGGRAASDSAAQTEQETSPLARGGIGPHEFDEERARLVDLPNPTVLMRAGEELTYARNRINTYETLARLAADSLPANSESLDNASTVARLDDARELLRLLRSELEDGYSQFFELGAAVEEMAARIVAEDDNARFEMGERQ